MATGDIYVVKMKQVYFTQEILNLFYYHQTAQNNPDTNAIGLADEFDQNVLADWAGMVNTSISITELETFAINNPIDNDSRVPLNNVGTRAIGDNLRAPSWIAAGFKSNRNGPGTRSSYRRFAGLGEEDIDDNVISPTFVALQAVQDLKASMAAILVTVSGSQYQPIQVPGGWSVGVYPGINFNLVSWLDPTLTSQVSRKP